MDLNQFLLALRARRKAFVLVFARDRHRRAGDRADRAARPTSPPRTVLVDARDEQSMTRGARHVAARARGLHADAARPDPERARGQARGRATSSYAQQPGVREDYERATGGVGTIEDWVAETLLKKLKVDASASNVITIAVLGRRPEARRRASPTPSPRPTSRRRSSCAPSPRARRRLVRGPAEGPARQRARRRRRSSPRTRRRRASPPPTSASTSRPRGSPSSRPSCLRRATPPTTRRRATSRRRSS